MKEFIKNQLEILNGTGENAGLIKLQEDEISSFLNGRDEKTLPKEERAKLQGLKNRFRAYIQRKEELEALAKRYEEFVSKKAKSSMLKKVDDVIFTKKNKVPNRKLGENVEVKTINDVIFKGKNSRVAEIDLSIEACEDIARKTSKKPSVVITGANAVASVKGDYLESIKQVIVLKALLDGETALTEEQKSIIEKLLTKFNNKVKRGAYSLKDVEQFLSDEGKDGDSRERQHARESLSYGYGYTFENLDDKKDEYDDYDKYLDEVSALENKSTTGKIKYKMGLIRRILLAIVIALCNLTKGIAGINKFFNNAKEFLLKGADIDVLEKGESGIKLPAGRKIVDGKTNVKQKDEESLIGKDMIWVAAEVQNNNPQSLVYRLMADEMSLLSPKVEKNDIKSIRKKMKEDDVPSIMKNDYNNLVFFGTVGRILKLAKQEGIRVTNEGGEARPIKDVYAELDEKMQLRRKTDLISWGTYSDRKGSEQSGEKEGERLY